MGARLLAVVGHLDATQLASAADLHLRLDHAGVADVIRGRHRWRLLVKAPRDLDLQAYLRTWLDSLPKPPADLRLTVDIDPYSFL